MRSFAREACLLVVKLPQQTFTSLSRFTGADKGFEPLYFGHEPNMFTNYTNPHISFLVKARAKAQHCLVLTKFACSKFSAIRLLGRKGIEPSTA